MTISVIFSVMIFFLTLVLLLCRPGPGPGKKKKDKEQKKVGGSEKSLAGKVVGAVSTVFLCIFGLILVFIGWTLEKVFS